MRNNLVILALIMGLHLFQNPIFSQISFTQKPQPVPKVISFDPDSSRYQTLFDGENDSVVFYSGVVTLSANKSGEIHNSENYEEMIIPLGGEGQLQIKNDKNLDVTFGKVALVPPHTEHSMKNTGNKDFKYIYIAVQKERK